MFPPDVASIKHSLLGAYSGVPQCMHRDVLSTSEQPLRVLPSVLLVVNLLMVWK